MNTTASALAAQTRVYSHPPFVIHGPLPACADRARVVHRADDRSGGERREEAEREQEPTTHFGEASNGRPHHPGFVTEPLEHLAGAFGAVTIEPTEQLLVP